MWVPSHFGITDKTADLGTRSILHPIITGIPFNYMKVSLKLINTLWTNYWDSIPLSNKLKIILKNSTKCYISQYFKRRQEEIPIKINIINNL